MWYPNKFQWVVIWVTALSAFAVWIFVPISATSNIRDRVVIALLVIGGLLVWQLSRGLKRVPGAEPQVSEPETHSQHESLAQTYSVKARIGILLLSGTLIAVSLTVTLMACDYSKTFCPSQVSQMLGASLLFAIFGYVLSKTRFRSKRVLGVLVYSILFVVYTSYHSVGLWQEGKQGRNTIQVLSTMVGESYAGAELPPRDFDEGTYGEMAPVLKVIYESYRSTQGDASKLERETEAVLTANPLGGEVFKETKNIARAQDELHRVIALLDGFESRLNMRVEKEVRDLNNLNIRESAKASVMKGYEETRHLRSNQISESFRIQKALLRKMDDCLVFIKSRDGKYKVVSNEILFASSDDLNEYKRFLSEIDALQTQYTSLVKAAEVQDLRRLEKTRTDLAQ